MTNPGNFFSSNGQKSGLGLELGLRSALMGGRPACYVSTGPPSLFAPIALRPFRLHVYNSQCRANAPEVPETSKGHFSR